MTRFILQILMLLLAFGFALWRGGRPEKLVASIFMVMMLMIVAYPIAHDGIWSYAEYSDFNSYRFSLDTLALIGVIYVALKFDRAWVLAVGSFQMIPVTTHLLRLANLPMDSLSYAVMERWPSWAIIILLGFGTWNHMRGRTKSLQVDDI